LRVDSVTASSAGVPQKDRLFSSIIYSPVIKGWLGSDMSISRAQPHLQPYAAKVNVPYTSSVVSASFLPGTFTAEWLLGQSFSRGPAEVLTALAQSLGETFGTASGCGGFCSQTGRSSGSVSSTSWGFRRPAATWLVSRTRKWPASRARKVSVPSALTPIE